MWWFGRLAAWLVRASRGETFKRFLPHAPSSNAHFSPSRKSVFEAPHFDLILMLAGSREIVGRLQPQPVVGAGPPAFSMDGTLIGFGEYAFPELPGKPGDVRIPGAVGTV